MDILLAVATNNENTNTLQIVLNFIKDSWPMIGAIVTIYKVIDVIAKYWSKRQEERFKLVIDAYIGKDIKSLGESIDELRAEIRDMKRDTHGK